MDVSFFCSDKSFYSWGASESEVHWKNGRDNSECDGDMWLQYALYLCFNWTTWFYAWYKCVIPCNWEVQALLPPSSKGWAFLFITSLHMMYFILQLTCMCVVNLGKYYLVDAGYPNRDGYLAPYKGEQYHVPDFQRGAPPNTPKEKFNKIHSSKCNCIERTFGVWNSKFSSRCQTTRSKHRWR